METKDQNAVSTGEWMGTMLITSIPLIGLIMLFVWAFGSSTNASKANWAKAALLWIAIVLCIYAAIFAFFGAALMSAFSN